MATQSSSGTKAHNSPTTMAPTRPELPIKRDHPGPIYPGRGGLAVDTGWSGYEGLTLGPGRSPSVSPSVWAGTIRLRHRYTKRPLSWVEEGPPPPPGAIVTDIDGEPVIAVEAAETVAAPYWV